MPNWCSNSITIQGSTETIKDLWEDANQEGSGLLDAMVPMPKELEGTTSPSDGDNWYNWRLKNWGCKWDIDVEEAGLEFTDNGDGTATITGGFQSPWAPPIEAYNTFLDDMDGCSLVADYHEPGMDFCGEYVDGDDNYYEGLDELIKGDAMKDDECFARLVEDYAIEEFYDDEEGIN